MCPNACAPYGHDFIDPKMPSVDLKWNMDHGQETRWLVYNFESGRFHMQNDKDDYTYSHSIKLQVSSLYRDHCYANESYWVTAAKILACEKNIVESIVRWYRSLGGGRVQWTGESACEARGVSLRSLWRGTVESFNLLKFHRKQIAAAGLDTYRFCRFTNSFSMRNDVEHRSK